MRRVKLPQSVKVGARTYKVKLSAKLADDRECDGQCDLERCIIWLQEGMPPERKLQVLLHELIHAIGEDRGIRLAERSTDQLALGLAAVVVDNGWRVP